MTTTAADPRWTNNAFGIDVSSIQKVIDYKLLKTSGVDFMIARCTHGSWTYRNVVDPAVAVDPLFATHCQGAYDNDMPFGAYTVFDPTVDPDPNYPLKDRQIAPIVYALNGKVGKSVHFLAVDIEIGKDADGRQIGGTFISNRASQLVARLHDIYPTLKIGVYTGQWFIDQYAPTLLVWMDLYAIKWNMFKWLARYPTDPDAPGSDVVNAAWSDFRGKYAPEWPATKNFPWLGNNEAEIWQFAGDKFTAPGHCGENASRLSTIDCNFSRKSKADFKTWCGFVSRGTVVNPTTPVADPTTPTTPTLDTTAINAKLDAAIASLQEVKALL